MTTKHIKDLASGDRVALAEGGVATIDKVLRCSIVDTAPGLGGAYEIQYHDEAGETGQMIVAGLSAVEIAA